MKRVLVIGCCGSGKSTLSIKLNQLTGLPLVHLDKEYWNEGWEEPPKSDFRRRVEHITQEDRWIIDGHYFSTLNIRLEKADTVFHLDYSTRTCLARVIKRTILAYGQDRTDCAKGCPERFNLDFLKYVFSYRGTFRERTISLLSNHQHIKVHHFTSPRQLTKYLNSASRSSLTASDSSFPQPNS